MLEGSRLQTHLGKSLLFVLTVHSAIEDLTKFLARQNGVRLENRIEMSASLCLILLQDLFALELDLEIRSPGILLRPWLLLGKRFYRML